MSHMPTTVTYAIALAEARSCLAALADAAASFDESIHFEHLLLCLDGMHEHDFPALYLLAGQRAELMRRLERAVDQMIDLGGDGLSLELVLADAGVWWPPGPNDAPRSTSTHKVAAEVFTCGY